MISRKKYQNFQRFAESVNPDTCSKALERLSGKSKIADVPVLRLTNKTATDPAEMPEPVVITTSLLLIRPPLGQESNKQRQKSKTVL